ncbi:MAG: GIY-YIG nuclease family protein [Rhodospirillales bacterium]
MFTFNDLLKKAGIEPKEVLLMRHCPNDSGLLRALPRFAVQRHDLFNAYQSVQAGRNSESALKNARYLASFIGINSGFAHFAGLYKNAGDRTITRAQYNTVPEYQELGEYGQNNAARRENLLWFQLNLEEFFQEWKGKMVINWPTARAWYQWAGRKNEFPVHAILDRSVFEEAMPEWNNLVLTWADLQILPSAWEAALKEWRGIYLIFDEDNQKSYVGAAYGKDNLLGRWRAYARTGHGGNRALRGHDHFKFRFSILQRVSPDMDVEDVIRLENTWKKRLHTGEFGLNLN